MSHRAMGPRVDCPKALVFIFILLAFCVHAFGQNASNLRTSLFNETDKLLARVQSEQANLLAPDNFKKAIGRYDQATKDFQKKKGIDGIEKKLAKVRTYLVKCLDVAKIGHVTFETTLKAREDALKANAPQYSQERYNRAESQFISAAKKLERNDVRGAKKKIVEIDGLYRVAELQAIKSSIIGQVRNLMREAKSVKADEVTPISYANALRLLNEAETILNSNRRSVSSAKEKAEKAEIEARHAIYLTREIRRLKKNQKEWENYILDREVLIEDIARELGFEAHFDNGPDRPLRNILAISRALQTEKRELLSEVTEKDAELSRLQSELQKYREKEKGLKAELQDKQYKLEIKRRHEELIHSVEQMFTRDQAVVLRKGEDIIIRLIGLTFPSGKATIKPEFFGLLAKVQRALRKFANSPLTIEGHTDALGDDRYNENLSFERAIAVKKYLLANMGLDENRIASLGYGESKPIASNETNSGRAKNRRIDIVIALGQQTL